MITKLVVELVSYLSEKLAPTTNLFGVMMSIYGKGVMITGKSGIGKSETALGLIKKWGENFKTNKSLILILYKIILVVLE